MLGSKHEACGRADASYGGKMRDGVSSKMMGSSAAPEHNRYGNYVVGPAAARRARRALLGHLPSCSGARCPARHLTAHVPLPVRRGAAPA